MRMGIWENGRHINSGSRKIIIGSLTDFKACIRSKEVDRPIKRERAIEIVLLVPYLISRTVLKRYTNLLESPHDTS
jgi:hypothetical protein